MTRVARSMRPRVVQAPCHVRSAAWKCDSSPSWQPRNRRSPTALTFLLLFPIVLSRLSNYRRPVLVTDFGTAYASGVRICSRTLQATSLEASGVTVLVKAIEPVGFMWLFGELCGYSASYAAIRQGLGKAMSSGAGR
jgi:hypothetical protein